MSEKSEAVRVVVRCRPLFGKELSEQRQSIVTCHKDSGQIEVDGPSGQRFTFDHAFGPNTKQHEIYVRAHASCGSPLRQIGGRADGRAD